MPIFSNLRDSRGRFVSRGTANDLEAALTDAISNVNPSAWKRFALLTEQRLGGDPWDLIRKYGSQIPVGQYTTGARAAPPPMGLSVGTQRGQPDPYWKRLFEDMDKHLKNLDAIETRRDRLAASHPAAAAWGGIRPGSIPPPSALGSVPTTGGRPYWTYGGGGFGPWGMRGGGPPPPGGGGGGGMGGGGAPFLRPGGGGFGQTLGLAALIRGTPLGKLFLPATLAEMAWGAIRSPHELGALEGRIFREAEPYINMRQQMEKFAQPFRRSGLDTTNEIFPGFSGPIPEWMARLGLGPGEIPDLLAQSGGRKPGMYLENQMRQLVGTPRAGGFANIPEDQTRSFMLRSQYLGVSSPFQLNQFALQISGVMTEAWSRTLDQAEVLKNIQSAVETTAKSGAGAISGPAIADLFGRIITGSNAPSARTGELALRGIAGVNAAFDQPLSDPFRAMTMARILQGAGPLSDRGNLARLVGGEARLRQLEDPRGDPLTLAALKALPQAQATGQIPLALLAYTQLMRGGGEAIFAQQFMGAMPGLPGNMPDDLRKFLGLLAGGRGSGFGAQGIGALFAGRPLQPDLTEEMLKKYPGISPEEARTRAEALQAGMVGSFADYKEFAQWIPTVNDTLRRLVGVSNDLWEAFAKLVTQLGGSISNIGSALNPIGSAMGAEMAPGGVLGTIMKYESRGRNIANYMFDRGHTASGLLQITNSEWNRYAPSLGIPTLTWPFTAMTRPFGEQLAVGGEILRTEGPGPWTRYNPALAHALGGAAGGLGAGSSLGGSSSLEGLEWQLRQINHELGTFGSHINRANRSFGNLRSGLVPDPNHPGSFLRVSP